jgi:hypothetical protein
VLRGVHGYGVWLVSGEHLGGVSRNKGLGGERDDWTVRHHARHGRVQFVGAFGRFFDTLCNVLSSPHTTLVSQDEPSLLGCSVLTFEKELLYHFNCWLHHKNVDNHNQYNHCS